MVSGDEWVSLSVGRWGELLLKGLAVSSVGASVGVVATSGVAIAERMGVPCPVKNPGVLAKGWTEGAEVALALGDKSCGGCPLRR